MFDPKGDVNLLKRMYVEAKRAGRESEFYVFHLGWPDLSARYNAVGRFGRISEVATRIAGQLSSEGNSAAFREFAWRFVNIIARALVELGQRPDYLLIQRHVVNIDALFIEYAAQYFAKSAPKAWEVIVQLEARINDKNIPRHMVGREKRVVALEQYRSQVRVYDPVLDGLRSAVRYDRTYFDKIVASLLPLLEKLTTGKTAQLLAPNYSDLDDPRPIFDWMQIIRKRAVVYVGLDALSDAEVAAAVGNSMFSDLVSVAGHIYKFGIDDGLPGGEAGTNVAINLHAEPFRFFGVMVGALVLSIVVECVCMALFRPEHGWRHARDMLNFELAQLSSEFTRSTLVQEPGRTARALIEQAYEWVFVKTGLATDIRDASQRANAAASRTAHDFRYYLGLVYVHLEQYLIAAAYMALVFLLRLLVLCMSLPLFLLAAFVGLVDGLVRRDLRRFSAGRESGFVYHRARASLMPLAVLPWVSNLALPISVHPLLVLVPCALLLGLAMSIAAGSFKKYL